MGRKTLGIWISWGVFLFFGKNPLWAQSSCIPGTPSYVVDLTSSPYTYWDSPNVSRSGNCCSTSNNCVEFIVYLHPLSGGVVLKITSGAMPPGSMYYRADCGAKIPIGDSMCLTGTGPFSITFCKPGGNPNTYRISSFARPAASPDLHIQAGCSATLWAVGFNQSSILWKSIYPGAQGTYDSWLSCTNECDTVVITPGVNPPPYIDYMVSGTPESDCSTVLSDTVRVYILPALQVEVVPDNPIVCYDSSTTTVYASVNGGLAPYSVLWSNGSTSTVAHLPSGPQWLRIKDQSDCPADTVFFMVSEITTPPMVETGDDIYVCYNEPFIELNAVYQGCRGVEWSGGTGSFFPSASSPHVWYYPSNNDRLSGQVTLTVTTTDTLNCSAAVDSLTIFFRIKPITSAIFHY
ncbi:MAG: SprB repeat-containing protein [Bacteroidales bacterium]